MTADTLTKDESIRLMQAEIERLRSKVDWLRDDRDQLITTASKQSVEIDRLRADLLTARGEVEDLSGEVERLRELLREWLNAGRDKYDDQDFVKRVREALGE